MISRIKNYMGMVKVEHTVFALPFAFTSALIAVHGFPTLYQIFWISAAIFGGRTAAMTLNRLIDARIDAQNPRTANRHIPAGKVRPLEAILIAVTGCIILVFSAYKLNRLSLELSPIPIAMFIIYPYTKRFTSLCHIILGITDGLAPFGAWVAVKGSVSISAFIISLAVGFWVAGFDIIYALQDVEFDRKHGLYSLPALIGERNALLLSKIFHLITLIGLIAVGYLESLGIWYYLGLLISSFLMVKEHILISRDKSNVGYAFFNLNGYISLTMFFFTVLNYLW